ncbi:ATP-binding cassette sub-family G member 4 isoform X1 [Anoplophora glabripennis]|uniref:ATP-binding cassette sub-family G member 4 isoform X1 n=1 Tax=Anoplophora glabripennis TaxID=217634 RepID=UPI00087507C8|nr:ATP-binding cassette sub-family G member 4 isoform X1 [Anoplophora glabripennis]
MATLATDNLLLKNRSPDVKVQITPAQPKKLTHLPERPKVDLAFSNLTYTVRQGKKDKIILKNVSGRLRSGELCAIMGPSGAGKSTLLNILTGYKTEGTTGQILMNNNERDLSQFRKLSAYIMQDNQLHANLTVDEAMTVAAKLKIGDKKLHDREAIITEILDTLGLLDHRKTMTSGLSGGQKKRLSIALELVSNPPIMFFDEPTSGLDSSSCFQCISLLKTLAKGGRTIICTIHQPSARLFEMFDQLYTLADGQCVYQGSTNQLVPFLGTLGLQCPSYHNPASYIIEVACGEYGDHTKKLVLAIDNGKNDIREGKPFPDLKFNNGFNNGDVFAKENMNTIMANQLSKESANSYSEKNLNVAGEQVVNNHVPKVSVSDKIIDKQDVNSTILENVIPIDQLKSKRANVNVEKAQSVGQDVQESAVDIEKPDVTSTLLENTVPVKQPRYGNTELQQFFIILKRALLFSRRDWTLMYLRLFAHILVGFLIGALYFKIGNDGSKVLSNLGFLFFNMLFLMYTSMTITILSFPLELPVLLKEHFNRWYSLRSYYLAITISDMPFQTVFCVLYVTIVYFMTSQPPELHRYGMFLLACLLVSFVAQSVGLVVGAAMNVQNGVFLAPVMSVPFLLFSGFFVSFDAIPIYLRWITYLSYIRYGFEGTALATYGFNRPKLECFTSYCHFKSPDTTLEELDMNKSSYTLDIVALVVIFFVLRISAFLFLKWKLKSNR